MQKTLFRIMETYSFRAYSLLTQWIPDIDHPQVSNVTVIFKWKKPYLCYSSSKNVWLVLKKKCINKNNRKHLPSNTSNFFKEGNT